MGLGDIKGHEVIRRLVARAVARDRLPPCLLLTGPDGVGKRRVALALAGLLNCEAVRVPETGDAGSWPDACGACAACRRIARGVHTDVMLIEPGETGTIKIDPIRTAVAQAAFRPFEGRRRVVIIDDADRLVDAAQNALLKILEEPPTTSVFLLVTSQPDVLLPTVRSRCPVLRFGDLPAGEIAEILTTRHDFDATAARAAAAAADGSAARALEAGSRDHVQDRQGATDVLRTLAAAPNAKRRLSAGAALVPGRRGTPAEERQNLTRRLRALASLLRDLQAVSVGAGPEWLANADLDAELTELARSYDAGRAGRGFASVGRAVQALSRNASAKVVVDWLTLQI